MNIQTINLTISDNTHLYRHFGFLMNNPIILHQDHIIEKGIGSGWMKLFFEGVELDLDQQKHVGNTGQRQFPVVNENADMSFDEEINEELFLLYDAAGLNYAHFFFDFFGRCLYFDELVKNNPNIKIAIPEDYYLEEGNSNFVKQWLDLYYKDKDIKFFVLKKNVRYKISTLIVPNSLYWFPEDKGDNLIMEKIIEVASKIEPLPVTTNGCYISRQDTIKRGWYHKRDLVNELEFIDRVKQDLNYDIIELMDYDIIGKIKIFKSYKNIVQQSSASNVNILFSNKENTHIILSNPKMEGWLNYKVSQFSNKCKANLITLHDVGRYLSDELDPNQADACNYPWELTDIEGIISLLKQIDRGEI
jgi:hypothetical protein